MINHILMPTDFSDCSKEAFDYAVYLAKRLGADFHLLYVFAPPYYPPGGGTLRVPPMVRQWITELKEDATKRFNALTEEAQQMDIKVHSIFKEGEPFEEILKSAEEITADVIVLGSHGRKGLDKFLMGSVAERVIRKAPCPVFLVRGETGKNQGGKMNKTAKSID